MKRPYTQTILLIDEDKESLNYLKNELTNRKYKVLSATTAQEGIDFTIKAIVDLIILDLNLPDKDGLAVIEFIRSFNNNVPMIVLTKRNSIDDKVMALDSGANDYVTKPYNLFELLARIRKEFRYLKEEEEHLITNGPLVIDYGDKVVYVNGKEVHLTNFEYKILLILAENLGRTVSYKDLINGVWGSTSGQDQNGLRVFVAGIRKKIEKDLTTRKLIRTCVGHGYRMEYMD